MKKDELTPMQRIERDAKRVQEILGVAVKYGLADWLDSLPVPGAQGLLHSVADSEVKDLPIEVRIRMALTELGPTFIKVGQLLGTRIDLVGPALADELSKLQTDTPPDPPAVVIAAIERELGQPVSALFAAFEPESYASASIAQVHRAVLRSGDVVAVKVRKEGIQAKIEADLSVLESLAEIGEDHSDTFKDYGAVRLVKEFRRSILNELDFTKERRNLETFACNFEDDETVHFPATWPALSGRTVLTMEYLEGPLGTDLEALRASGEDLNAFAYRGAGVYLNMIFRDGFYHADPHPGNLMLLPGGVVGILDCGMVGRVDDGLRSDLESMVAAITQGDVDGLADTLWAHAKTKEEDAKDELRADLADLLPDAEGSLDDVASILNGILAIFPKYRLTPRPGLTALLRMIVLLDGTARRLSPQFSLKTILEPYQAEAIRRRTSPRHLLKRFQKDLVQWDTFLEALPGELTDTLQKVRSGEFKVRLEHRHLDMVINRLVLGIVTAAVILGSSLLWSMKAAPLVNGVSFFGALGYFIAMVLGWFLYRAIKDSGKIAPED